LKYHQASFRNRETGLEVYAAPNLEFVLHQRDRIVNELQRPKIKRLGIQRSAPNKKDVAACKRHVSVDICGNQPNFRGTQRTSVDA